MYDRLFSPIKIGTLELKNRIVMPAIHLMYNMEGYATEQSNMFYWRRAEGGAGLVVVGGCRFDEYGGSPGMMSLASDEFIPGYKEFTDGMHQRGAKVAVQLYHAGAYAHSIANEGRDALAPSAVFSKFTKEMPREMTVEELQTIIEKWAAAAVRAKKAGFDMVEISASAGYLICQFLSPKTNLRTDDYGGSWENRTRFARELIASVRSAVGDDYPLCIRIAGNDFVVGSNTNTEAVEFAKLMEQAGVDMINVTGGWHETVIPQLTGDVPEAGLSYLAAAIKDGVSIPVAVSNRISDPAIAEKLLAVGEADMVSIGRPLIADPDWAKKAQEGSGAEIRRCLACNQRCLARTFFAEPVECLINIHAGRECEEKPSSPSTPKNILVVGAGAAGCEYAILAAERGHKVTIWEQSDRIGGQLHYAAALPSKKSFLNLVDYHSAMLEKLGVNVVLKKTAVAAEIASSVFDLVVVASGNVPTQLDPGWSEKIPVCTAFDVFQGKVTPGKNIVFVGGGAVGCECAGMLALEAALSPEQVYFLLSQRAETVDKVLDMLDNTRRKITIIDALKVGSGFEQGTAWPLFKDLNRLGVAQYSFAKVLEVTDKTVEIEAVEPKTREQNAKERETGVAEPEKIIRLSIPCDTIVTAVGSSPNDGLYNELSQLGVKVQKIGDSNEVGGIYGALMSAADAVSSI